VRTGGKFDVADLDGAAAILAWYAFIATHGEPQHLAKAMSGRDTGGIHYYCVPGGHKTVRSGDRGLPPGVEIKGQGGYVVAPPSTHISGTPYRWVEGASIADGQLHGAVPFDEWYERVLTPREPPWTESLSSTSITSPARAAEPPSDSAADDPQDSARRSLMQPASGPGGSGATGSTDLSPDRAVAYGRAALRNAIDRVPRIQGARWLTLATDALVVAARAIRGGSLDLAEALGELEATARDVGLDEREVQRIRTELERLLPNVTNPIAPPEPLPAAVVAAVLQKEPPCPTSTSATSGEPGASTSPGSSPPSSAPTTDAEPPPASLAVPLTGDPSGSPTTSAGTPTASGPSAPEPWTTSSPSTRPAPAIPTTTEHPVPATAADPTATGGSSAASATSPPAAPTAGVIGLTEVYPDPVKDPAAQQAAELAARALAEELLRMRARRSATRILDAEDAARTFREPPYRPTLTEELALPEEPVAYTIDQVLPAGGNVLLTAQYKTGKTTLVNALARSLADRRPFLGRFDVADLPGRVALWNYEVDERQYRRWLREVGFVDTDRVCVLHLRGYRLPLSVPHVEDWVVCWLEEHKVALWVVDPFARAFVGAGRSENDNTEVGAFLDTLDVIQNRAGVSDLVLPTHTGRAEVEAGDERARGATRLDDWADVRWFLTKDDNDERYFRATGRDVDVAEEKLGFDPVTRALTLGGWDRRTERRRRVSDAIVAFVEAHPGCTVRDLEKGLGMNKELVSQARHEALAARVIKVVEGRRGALQHYLPGVIVS
jgi:hypothetical protein